MVIGCALTFESSLIVSFYDDIHQERSSHWPRGSIFTIPHWSLGTVGRRRLEIPTCRGHTASVEGRTTGEVGSCNDVVWIQYRLLRRTMVAVYVIFVVRSHDVVGFDAGADDSQ